VGSDRRRRILRFFGARGDLLAAEAPNLVVYDAGGHERFRAEVPDFIDIAAVGEELWAVSPGLLTRLSIRTGERISEDKLEYLDPKGHFLVSTTAPTLPVWHADRPVVLRANPVRTEVPGPAGAESTVILPIAEGRWLLWQNGQLRLWRSIGEAWRKPLGEPGTNPIDAQLVLDGRLFVLAQQRPPRAGEAFGELRLSVAATTDGAPHTQLRLPQVSHFFIAARRGFAAVRSGDRVGIFDLRFGRWIRDLVLPPGITELAIDDSLQRIALGSASGLELVRPDALQSAQPLEDEAPPIETEAPTNGHAPAALVDIAAVAAAEVTLEAADLVEPAADSEGEEPLEALPDAPLVRLDPVAVLPNATPSEVAQSIDLRVQLVGARVHVAIAEAWDAGRISKPDQQKPPFYDEVHGLLRLVTGRAPGELASAVSRQRATEDMTIAAERGRGGRLTPLDVLARDFELSQIAVSILFAIVAPRLRGELARLYGILANDPGRPLVDEFLLGQILGAGHAHTIARELDGDRPLRKYGLVKVAPGDRPFAALTIDPLVARYIANQPVEGEPDQHLTLRNVDRDLEELQVPRSLIVKALRFLSTPRAKLAGDAEQQRPDEPVRIVVRGRTGSGRHTLLTSLAARAGRSVGVIDLSTVPREAGRLAHVLEAVLRRAMLRGLLPCVDGLELIGSEDPDTKIQVAAVLRTHPGPIALRLPPDGSPPLEPGYLMIDVPLRNERERGESWALALDRHQIDLPDASELAARYRVGPGIIERVADEVSRRPDPPSDASAWVRELDDAVRQHLENRLGQTATRVTRLAKWTDIVLPEDITDSLLELTARVRHRKTVYEKWGFDRSLTTARGITALFQGAPGTGKTMVAGVIARDLGLELYRVDVSRITSKWIGETEKNLGALFDAAEDGQVMLLFDEADSLFAKRTEVKTSVDRYSNMEVNYLLQRLDSFEGIAVLTTNFGNAIDPAFKRRLTYRMTFPFPDEEMREQLWRTMIPAQVPIAGTIDFAGLSQRFRLSGGYIRNAALRAAFLAVEEGSALTHEHLERAIRMEFREIGKLAETGALE
jgi:hypothetical protein